MAPDRLIKLVIFSIAVTSVHVSGRENASRCYHCAAFCTCCTSLGTAKCSGKSPSHLFIIPRFPDNITSLEVLGLGLPVVTRQTFENIQHLKLQRLMLVRNGMKHISESAFADLKYLKDVIIAHNVNLKVNELRASLKGLSKNLYLNINITSMDLKDLDEDFFSGLTNSKLVSLSLRRNQFTVFNESVFRKLPNLQTLDLAFNQITEKVGQGLPTLRSLNLQSNRFIQIPQLCKKEEEGYYTALYPRLKMIDLQNCWINAVSRTELACLDNLKVLQLSRNIIFQIENNTFSDLVSLEVLALDNMYASFREIQYLAFNISSLKSLSIQGNRIKMTTKQWVHKFKFCPNLERLSLGGNTIDMSPYIIHIMFAPLTRLIDLDITRCSLRSLPYDMLGGFVNLTSLYLNDNKFVKWNPNIFRNVSNLKHLYMSSNGIHVITEGAFPPNIINTLQTLDLQDNKFHCNCDMLWFRNWIGNHRYLMDIYSKNSDLMYRCAYPVNMVRTSFKDFQPTKESCTVKNVFITISAILGVLMVVSIVATTIGYRERWYLKYWFFKWKRKWRTGETLLLSSTDGNEYDCYVIYNAEDVRFIQKDLCEIVEEKLGFKLLIHDRDSRLGGSKFETIADDIYNCRRVIAILSSDFLADPWCKFQVDVAVDRQVELGVNLLFLLKLEEVQNHSLTKAWCVLFTRTPSAEWSRDPLRRQVIEQQLSQHLATD